MDASLQRRLIISYETTDRAIWQRIQPDFIAQLPLRNLHWKTASRSLRTIQSLEIDLRNFQTLPAEQAQQIPPSLLERPYLHLLFVVCDDNEVYRSTIRQTIRDWLDAVTTRRNQEWLIIHVASSRAGPAKFYQRKGTVADKIRADFNIGKRDRVSQLVLGGMGAAEDPVLWAELISKMKDSIITTFDANVITFEEEVRKTDSQRALPGWNFCMFFIQKEGLALSFEAMNLLEDALIQYDELEASFFQSLRENTLVWFGKLGGTAQGDDSIDLFSANAKPYRDLIKSNTISLFDFRVYLFARQGSLLGRLGRTLEIAKRGMSFIGSLGHSLRQQQSLLESDFVAAWTYSAATQIVDHCNRSLAGLGGATGSSAAHHAIRAELLDLACKQLTKIGMAHKLLPSEEPFSGSLDEEPPSPTSPLVDPTRPPSKTFISHPAIQAAIHDASTFHQLFGESLARTYSDYLASQRHRAADRLQALLSAHDRLCDRDHVALTRLVDVSGSYHSPHWPRIESSLLYNLGTLQEKQGDHREQLLTALSLLRAGSSLRSSSWEFMLPMSKYSSSETASGWIADVRKLSLELEKDADFAAIAFPTFEVRLASEIGYRDQATEELVLHVVVSNYLPCVRQPQIVLESCLIKLAQSVLADDIRLKLTTAHGQHIWFAAGSNELVTGMTRLLCRSLSNVAGVCFLETSQIRLSKVVFQYAHRHPIREIAPDIKRVPQTLSPHQEVYFALDPLAIHFQFIEPSTVLIDKPRTVILRVSAGRSDVKEALLSLSTAGDAVRFDLTSANVHGSSQSMVSTEKRGLRIDTIKQHQSLDLEIAFSMNTGAPTIEVQIDLSYSAQTGPQTVTHTRSSLPLVLDLPLAVSVQEHFRQQRASSCYNISTSVRGGLRIKEVRMEGAFAKSPQCLDAPPTVILPDQTARCTFMFSSEKDTESIQQPKLIVAYRQIAHGTVYSPFVRKRPLYECSEIRHHIRCALEVVADGQLLIAKPLLEELSEVLASSVADHRDYALFDRLRLPPFDRQHWHEELTLLYGEGDMASHLLSAIEALSRLESVPTNSTSLTWRTLEIPIERPSMPIVCQTSIELPEDCKRLIAGQSITATINVKVVFSWASSRALYEELTSHLQRLSYDVTADLTDWVIAGRKKGEFAGKDEGSFAVDLTFVPLRIGRLFLPRVVVTAVPADATMKPPLVETYQANAARQVDVLPAQSRSTFIMDL